MALINATIGCPGTWFDLSTSERRARRAIRASRRVGGALRALAAFGRRPILHHRTRRARRSRSVVANREGERHDGGHFMGIERSTRSRSTRSPRRGDEALRAVTGTRRGPANDGTTARIPTVGVRPSPRHCDFPGRGVVVISRQGDLRGACGKVAGMGIPRAFTPVQDPGAS